MNAERRIQRVRAALRPVGRIEARLADRLRDRARDGRIEDSSSAIRKRSGTKCGRLCTGARGMTYARLDARRPAVAVSRPRIIRARRSCTRDVSRSGPRATLRCVDYRADAGANDDAAIRSCSSPAGRCISSTPAR